jgi:dolichyl-phosphate-mannose--protein O-mannosyl transferase
MCVCGKMNRQNVRIWGTENPHATMEHVRDPPKVNVFFAVSYCKVYGPFFLFGAICYRYQLLLLATFCRNVSLFELCISCELCCVSNDRNYYCNS